MFRWPGKGTGRNIWSQHTIGFPEFLWLKKVMIKKKPDFPYMIGGKSGRTDNDLTIKNHKELTNLNPAR
jgi:hypothetical protein